MAKIFDFFLTLNSSVHHFLELVSTLGGDTLRDTIPATPYDTLSLKMGGLCVAACLIYNVCCPPAKRWCIPIIQKSLTEFRWSITRMTE